MSIYKITVNTSQFGMSMQLVDGQLKLSIVNITIRYKNMPNMGLCIMYSATNFIWPALCHEYSLKKFFKFKKKNSLL